MNKKGIRKFIIAFLILLLALVFVLVGSIEYQKNDSPAMVELTLSELFQPEIALTVEGATEIVLRVDALADRIEQLYPDQLRSKEAVQGFILEIAPYAVYERIMPENTNYGDKGRLMLPTREILPDIMFRHYGGQDNFHLMGTAACHDLENPVMNISLRYFNPASPLFNKAASQIAVTVHELMHMQGICTDVSKGGEDVADIETATQIATLEVLAAMTRHGNEYGLLPFLREIQDYAEDFLLLDAVKNGTLDAYKQNIVAVTANNIYREASFAKSMDHWFESPSLTFRLKEILTHYGVQPYEYIIEALNDEDYETRKLPFPNKRGKIQLNDIAWVLDRLTELVNDYHLIVIVWD